MSHYQTDAPEDALPGPRRHEPSQTVISTGTLFAVKQNNTGHSPYSVLKNAGGEGAPVSVCFSYHPKWPREIVFTAQYPWSDCAVVWRFDRELLVNCNGLGGDIRISYQLHDVLVVLDSPEGYAELLIPSEPIQRFLERILAAVPIDQEPSIAPATDAEWAAVFRLPSPSRARRILARTFPRAVPAADRVARAGRRLQRIARLIAKECRS